MVRWYHGVGGFSRCSKVVAAVGTGSGGGKMHRRHLQGWSAPALLCVVVMVLGATGQVHSQEKSPSSQGVIATLGAPVPDAPPTQVPSSPAPSPNTPTLPRTPTTIPGGERALPINLPT